jgi:ribonuclease VapC
MAEAVLDASAILALLRAEPGSEQVESVIADALVSVVNESEVISKLIWRGQTPEQALDVVRGLPYRLAGLDSHLARRAGVLWQVTKPQGLSFADRCCLALAEREGLPVLTADCSWGEVDIGLEINLLPARRGR